MWVFSDSTQRSKGTLICNRRPDHSPTSPPGRHFERSPVPPSGGLSANSASSTCGIWSARPGLMPHFFSAASTLSSAQPPSPPREAIMQTLTDDERLALKYIATPPPGTSGLPPAVLAIAPALRERGLIQLRGGRWTLNDQGVAILHREAREVLGAL